MASQGPLGTLPGMIYDPIRGKYFRAAAEQPARPTPPFPSAPPARISRSIRFNGPVSRFGSDGLGHSRKRTKTIAPRDPVCEVQRAYLGDGAGPSRLPGPGSRERRLRSTLAASRVQRARESADYYANMQHVHSAELVDMPCERFTSLNVFLDGSLFASTDHGRVVMQRQDQCTNEYTVCGGPVLGVHLNMPRNTMLSVIAGPQPHIHRGSGLEDPDGEKRDDFVELNVQDAFSMSSLGDLLSIGGNQQLICVDSGSDRMKPWHARRRLQSDALAVHHAEPDTVYAGLRNSEIVAIDFRASGRATNAHTVIGQSTRRKAIVGVRRLKDLAVPYGLVASGMANELLLFDIRFGKTPLRSLPGHVNTWFGDLGLATTFDDQILFAAGSDNRIRAWDLLDGQRLSPTHSNPLLLSENSINPLTRVFEERPSAIQLTESGMMDVAVAGSVHRFSRRTVVTHHPMTTEPTW